MTKAFALKFKAKAISKSVNLKKKKLRTNPITCLLPSLLPSLPPPMMLLSNQQTRDETAVNCSKSNVQIRVIVAERQFSNR